MTNVGNYEDLRTDLRDMYETAPLGSLVLRSAHAIRSSTVGSEGFKTLRGWLDYASTNNVTSDDPFALRHHLERFAGETFAVDDRDIEVLSVSIGEIADSRGSYASKLGQFIDESVFADPNVAIRGGAARIALRMFSGLETRDELPLNDVDLIVSASSGDVSGKAKRYGADLAGVQIVDGDIVSQLGVLFAESECTMNQVAVAGGKLYYSDEALQDLADGNIRLTGAKKSLFPADSYILPNGGVYIDRPGFYRGLSFLVRGKGQRLIVSQENLDAEVKNIGRYWLVMLYAKVLTMKDEQARYTAVAHWHEIAHRLGATETDDPSAFLAELVEKYPGMRVRAGEKKEPDPESDVRWIAGKLMSRSIDHLIGRNDARTFPETYTPANIELNPNIKPFDKDKFESLLDEVRSKN